MKSYAHSRGKELKEVGKAFIGQWPLTKRNDMWSALLYATNWHEYFMISATEKNAAWKWHTSYNTCKAHAQ